MSTCWNDIEVYSQMDPTSSSNSSVAKSNLLKNDRSFRLNRTQLLGLWALFSLGPMRGASQGLKLIKHVLVAGSSSHHLKVRFYFSVSLAFAISLYSRASNEATRLFGSKPQLRVYQIYSLGKVCVLFAFPFVLTYSLICLQFQDCSQHNENITNQRQCNCR